LLPLNVLLLFDEASGASRWLFLFAVRIGACVA
jgi:hypothetical protein